MQIECKLKREGGTTVTIGADTYHFAEQADGAHVADVAKDEHIDRLLSISEAYRVYRAGKPETTDAAPVTTESKPAEPVAGPVATDSKPTAKKKK